MDNRTLFFDLFRASTESELDTVIQRNPALLDSANWKPYGGNENNYAVVENQQAAAVPALVEKITNSVDAILMRRCLEEDIDPKGPNAPGSVEEAVERFFPKHTNWDLTGQRKGQAERIQVVADGPKKKSSVIVYDDGEGQHPDDFEDTFLSLLRGNKNDVLFVQGKYNMGGAGALIFCGDKRYQLVASRRYTGGPFGFTLLRKHPMTAHERDTKKNTWYEYLKIDGAIPRFDLEPGETLDLGLHNRGFKTGSILKLYSYELPKGSRSVFSRDLNQSINEYLFEPALPVLTVETEARYPHDRNRQRDLFGLKRRLEESERYVEEVFSETVDNADTGPLQITCYVFRPRVAGKSAKESKETLRREFFKNGMSVPFSLNGQVHGYYTTEFITRSLKFPLLKDYLLIHVDCTRLHLEFRSELFMASRDRLKTGKHSAQLREIVAKALRTGRLKEIYKHRKDSISVEGEDTDDLIRSFAGNLPLNTDLMRLLDQTFKLDRKDKGKSKPKPRSKPDPKEPEEFEGQRFPTFLKVNLGGNEQDGIPVARIPLGGERTIRLSTDAEDQYLDRTHEPGELKISLLDFKPNDADGGTAPGLPRDVTDAFNVVRSSPSKGMIRITLNPKKEVQVGDAARIKVTLTGPGRDHEGIFWAKVTDKENKPKPKKKDEPDPGIGLPKCVRVYQEETEGAKSWDDLESQGASMNHDTVMHPLLEGDTLSLIYVNMDARVLKNYKSGLTSSEQHETAERRFVSAVYFHTLFLYMINKNRGYEITRATDDEARPEPVDLTEYLKDLFESYYSEFLLNFEMGQLMTALAD